MQHKSWDGKIQAVLTWYHNVNHFSNAFCQMNTLEGAMKDFLGIRSNTVFILESLGRLRSFGIYVIPSNDPALFCFVTY